MTTFSATYKLYGNVLDEVSGSVVPAAITYKRDNSGNYVLENMSRQKMVHTGSHPLNSFHDACIGKENAGTCQKIVDYYGNYDDIRILRWENLSKHLKANGIKDATLFNSRGEIEFSMSNPQYIN